MILQFNGSEKIDVKNGRTIKLDIDQESIIAEKDRICRAILLGVDPCSDETTEEQWPEELIMPPVVVLSDDDEELQVEIMHFCKKLQIDLPLQDAVKRHNKLVAKNDDEKITFTEMFDEFLQRYTTYLQLQSRMAVAEKKPSDLLRKDAKTIATVTIDLMRVMAQKHYDHQSQRFVLARKQSNDNLLDANAILAKRQSKIRLIKQLSDKIIDR